MYNKENVSTNEESEEVTFQGEQDRFIYKKGDTIVGDSQCSFCSFSNNSEICENYPNGKPKDILEGKNKCKFLVFK